MSAFKLALGGGTRNAIFGLVIGFSEESGTSDPLIA
jgi:hypothetical protein